MFPNLFEYFRSDLSEQLELSAPSAPTALSCDRWIARSLLQKSIRRGDAGIAERALATIFLQDKRAAWRSLVVIALEDLGVAGIDVLAAIVAATGDARWRTRVGGDWPVAAALVKRMAASDHCQAACDLLLLTTESPELEAKRIEAVEYDLLATREILLTGGSSIGERALAALALTGTLGDGPQKGEVEAAFHWMSENGRSLHVLATCHAAWRISRNPMALLLPLMWDEWAKCHDLAVEDDWVPQTTQLGEIPSYSIDQFTRSGLAALRRYSVASPRMRELLDRIGIGRSVRPRTVGDILFLVEGGCLVRRVNWPLARRLRRPRRPLRGTFLLGHHSYEAEEIVASELALIDELRLASFQSAARENAAQGRQIATRGALSGPNHSN